MKKIYVVGLLVFLFVVAGAVNASSSRARRIVKPTASITSSSAKSSRAASSKQASSSKSSVTPVPLAPVTPPHGLRIPVLVYHHIRENEGWGPDTWSAKMSVSPKGFEKQMAWLADHNYTAINLDTFVQIVKGERAGPEKPVVLTFDDNNRSALDIGIPIMQKYGMMGVFYLVTNRLDNKLFINRNDIPAMVQKGMDIQSHTVTHSTLTKLSLEKLDAELRDSKKVLEDITGKPVQHVAYPSTTHNALVHERTKAAGYLTGSIMDPVAATEKTDLYKLPRIMMIDSTNLAKVLP